jgi:hypothetical protein
MYSSLTLLQDVLFSKLHYPYLYYGLRYKSSEFGNVMLSLLDRVEAFEKIIIYMLLLQADYTIDFYFYDDDVLDTIGKMLYENISKRLHHKIFYALSFKIKTVTYLKHKNSRLKLSISPSLVIPIQNAKLANLFANVVSINNHVRKFSAPILSYITLLM